MFTEPENEMLGTLYAEVELAQEWITTYKNDMDDRNCTNPEYYRDLIVKWQDEENLLLDRINKIESNAKERNDKQTLMVL